MDGCKGTMEIDAKVNILGDGESVKIEVFDDASGIRFLVVKMTPEQFTAAAFGRRGHANVKSAVVADLEKVGLVQIVDQLVFPFDHSKCDWDNRETIAAEAADAACPEGWEADHYFGSQDSFYTRDGDGYARTIIRRWVHPESEEAHEYARKKNAKRRVER